MRVIINITEERSVVYALKVLENLKKNSELRATAFVYRGPIKEKLIIQKILMYLFVNFFRSPYM